jgi:uncharacterized alkaline shock family protein YloU
MSQQNPSKLPAGETAPHVAGTVVARIAGYYARQTPGVAALQADLRGSILGLADRVFGRDNNPALSAEGVHVAIDGQTARIEITAVTRLGYNCRTVAETIQQEVATQIAAHTDLAATVAVTIIDIALDHTVEEP